MGNPTVRTKHQAGKPAATQIPGGRWLDGGRWLLAPRSLRSIAADCAFNVAGQDCAVRIFTQHPAGLPACAADAGLLRSDAALLCSDDRSPCSCTPSWKAVPNTLPQCSESEWITVEYAGLRIADARYTDLAAVPQALFQYF